jgi:uncharacterized protein DUF4375
MRLDRASEALHGERLYQRPSRGAGRMTAQVGFSINTRTGEAIVDWWSPALADALSTTATSRIRIRRRWRQTGLEELVPFGNQLEQVSLEGTLKDISAIGRLGGLRSVSLRQGVEQIDFSALPHLHTVRVWGEVKSLASLRACPSLTALSLGGCGLTDLEALQGLRGLLDLEILETPLRALTGLAELPALRRLVLSQVPLGSVDGLQVARALSTLVLVSLRRLTSIASLRDLPELETLTIDGSRKIADLSALGGLKSVRELRLIGLPLPSVEFLSRLTRLRVLGLESVGKVASLHFLRALPELEGLALTERTVVTDGDMSILLELPALKRVQYTERRHYRPSREDIRKVLNTRADSVEPDRPAAPSRGATSLAAVLPIPAGGKGGDAEFMRRLVDLLSSRGLGAAARRPEAIRMILGIHQLWLDASTGGLWKYFEEWKAGDDYADILRWCRLIGAARAAGCLEAAAAVFPQGLVPRNDEERRRYVDQLGRRGSTDPLAKLDRDYRDAVHELPQALRTYLRDHGEDVESWLGSKPQ